MDLKQNLREEGAAIFSNMLQQVMQNFQKRLGEYFDNKETSPHRRCIQEMNVVIKILEVKDNFSNKFA